MVDFGQKRSPHFPYETEAVQSRVLGKTARLCLAADYSMASLINNQLTRKLAMGEQ